MPHEIMGKEKFRGDKGFKKTMSAFVIMVCAAVSIALLVK